MEGPDDDNFNFQAKERRGCIKIPQAPACPSCTQQPPITYAKYDLPLPRLTATLVGVQDDVLGGCSLSGVPCIGSRSFGGGGPNLPR